MYPNLFPRKFEKLNFCVRFVIGRPLDNKARTDASFWHAATKGYPSRWLRLPGYARAGVRLGTLYLLLLAAVLAVAFRAGQREWAFKIIFSHVGTLSLLAALVAVPRLIRAYGLSLPLVRLEEREEGRRARVVVERVLEGRSRWERTKVLPVAKVVGPLLQIEHRRLRPHEARKWVTVPRSYLSPTGRPVEIELPPHFSGADERHCVRVVKAVSAALGASEMEPSWQLAGENRRLLLSAPVLPPEKVLFADVLKHLESAEEYRPVLGMVSPEKVLHAEMIADSPHILASGGPGSGKSTLLSLIAAQVMHWGWGVIVLDWKRTKAFEWMRGLPGVRIVNELEGIHDMGVTIGEEVETRMSSGGMAGKSKLLIIRDEWNITATLLQEYWIKYRAMLEPEERRVTPVRSPGLQGFNILDFAGREYGMHDLLAAQKASNRIFNFNTDMRECFNIRLLARYSPETKRMLVGNMKPFPKKSNIPGRWTAVSGEEVAVVQVPLGTGGELREFALAGKPCPISPFASVGSPEMEGSGNPRVAPYTPPTQGEELPDGVTPAIESLPILDGNIVATKPMKLSAMVESLEHFGITKKILQHAAGDPLSGFPVATGGTQFKGYEYDFVAVKEWAHRRTVAMKVERAARK
jgi:hypothetical protein